MVYRQFTDSQTESDWQTKRLQAGRSENTQAQSGQAAETSVAVKAANKSRVSRRFRVRRSFKTDKQETEPEIEVVKYKLYLGAFR